MWELSAEITTGRKEGQRVPGASPFLFTNCSLPCPSARLLAVAARGPISWEESQREAFLVRPSLHCNANTSASRNHTATIYWLFALCILWIALHLILNKSSTTNFIVCSQLHGETGYTGNWVIGPKPWLVSDKAGIQTRCTWHWSSSSLLSPLGTTMSNTLARSGRGSSLSSDPDWNSWRWRYQHPREKQYVLPKPRSTIHYPQGVNGVLWSEDTQVCGL